MEKVEGYTLLKNYRYERKFVVDNFSEYQTLNIIKSATAHFRSVFFPRYINNIYLDTPNFEFYYDNVQGSGNRKKIRIRWYNDLLGTISKPILEIKIKEAYLGTKKSYVLPSFNFDTNFTEQGLHNLFLNADLPDDIREMLKGLEIKLVNRYKRTYFVDISGIYRLTLDTDIVYYNPGINFMSSLMQKKDRNRIVEIKYDEQYNDAASTVCNSIKFRMTKNSKYINGVETFYPVNT